MSKLARYLRLWFTFGSPVSRRRYLMSGILLATIKYLGDLTIVWLSTGRIWQPTDYFSPLSSLASGKLHVGGGLLLPLLATWDLPFLWIGVSMSMRRALDAGLSAWLALLFFVPGLNYVLMATLCMVPSREPRKAKLEKPRPQETMLPGALMAIVAGTALGLAMLVLSVNGIASYGAPLFLGTPFVIGTITAYLLNRRYPASRAETYQVAVMTFGCIGGVLLLTAAEGAICLFMAAPLGVLIGIMGASLGRHIAGHDNRSPANAWIAIAMLPASVALDANKPATALREVKSAVVIDAPALTVWRNVIAFPPLPEPSELMFRAGIAYPRRAQIVGEGVGAVRYCVFSTGSFVEPITRWEPGRRLSFDVARQPRPLHEWSPYSDIAPPHLDGYFRSRRGEFRLVPLVDGRTRLEGSTWYEMRLDPAAYWVLFGDAFISRIHHRVLNHIKALAEGDGGGHNG